MTIFYYTVYLSTAIIKLQYCSLSALLLNDWLIRITDFPDTWFSLPCLLLLSEEDMVGWCYRGCEMFWEDIHVWNKWRWRVKRLTQVFIFHSPSAVAAVNSSQWFTSSPASCKDCSPPLNFVNGHVLTTWFMVCCWPHTQRSDEVRSDICVGSP